MENDMKNIRPFICLVFILFFSSCTITTHYLQEGAKAYPATTPDKIKIFSGEKAEKDFIVLGSVAVDTPGDGESAATALKQEAASLGATAIINVRLTKVASSTPRTGASGTAVRYKD
jgi:hypothetical protein